MLPIFVVCLHLCCLLQLSVFLCFLFVLRDVFIVVFIAFISSLVIMRLNVDLVPLIGSLSGSLVPLFKETSESCVV